MINYTDTTLMPKGRYAGQQLKNVPASHFVWLHDIFGMEPGPLRDYVRERIEALRKQAERDRKLLTR